MLGDFARLTMRTFLVLQIGACDDASSCSINFVHMARGSVVEQTTTGQGSCGWIGVAVSPMTGAFAESLGMDEPYGAIFDQPDPDSPAAAAGIEQGDVLTRINGSALQRASDFANIISAMPPGTQINLNTLRNGELMLRTLTLGSTPCRKSQGMRGQNTVA